MSENILLKILCSIPIILIVLYYIPFLGICLVLFKCFLNRYKKYYSTPIFLLIFSIMILIPKLIISTIRMLKLEKISIPYLNDIVNSKIYAKLLSYSKFLITISIIVFLVLYIVKVILKKADNSFRNYINKQEQKDYEISQKNDLIMKEKQEKAKILMLWYVQIVVPIICLKHQQEDANIVGHHLNIVSRYRVIRTLFLKNAVHIILMLLY